MVDSKRRAEIERLLVLRGRLLVPKEEVITRALRRCVKHSANFVPESGDGDSEMDLSADGTGAIPTDAVNEVPIQTQSEEIRIATAVAHAVTVTETQVDENLDLSTINADTTGLVPAEIKRGDKTIKGLAPGSVVKGYRIEKILGVGGMGQVYSALQISMNRRVAFKILTPRLAKNPEFRERFTREARNAGRLQHPNLIAVHDVDESQGLYFFSMELVEGDTLKKIIADQGTILEERALLIIRSCLEGLSYAHAKGLIHRDIKPDNIMVTSDNQVKIADLGLSRLDEGAEDSPEVTTTGVLMGTPHYMAPEQSRDAHSVDARADLYATGATLYHMLYGKVPFEGSDSMNVLVRAATQPLVFPKKSNVSASTRKLIAALMEKDPANRTATAQEAIALINGDLGDRSTHGDSLTSQTEPKRGYRGIIAWFVAITLVAILGVAVMIAMDRFDERKAWDETQRSVNGMVETDRYYQAVNVLEAYLEGNPAESYIPLAQEQRDELIERWDQFVKTTHAAFIKRLDDLMYQKRYSQAEREIRLFAADPSKMSPWMTAHLEKFRGIIAEEK